MNALKSNYHSVLRLFLAVSLVVSLSPMLNAASPKPTSEKGAERLQSLTKVSTYVDLENLKAGDKFVMVCAKCQTVMMHTVSKSKGRDIPTITAKHLCSGCNSTIETVGHGKMKTDAVKHSCSGCGDSSVFCCSTSKAGKATEGMDKH